MFRLLGHVGFVVIVTDNLETEERALSSLLWCRSAVFVTFAFYCASIRLLVLSIRLTELLVSLCSNV